MKEVFRAAIYTLAAVAIFFVLMVALCLVAIYLSYSYNPFPRKGFDTSPNTFKKSDLVGTWQAIYDPDRIDTITLRADGTYKQVYRELDGYTYESPWNRWYLEYRPSGWIYVYLEGMRYYANDIETGESGGRKPATTPGIVGEPAYFYDHGEEKIIEMLDKVILRVVGFTSKPRGVLLVHMSTSVESGGPMFTLCRKCAVETPTAQMEGLQCCQMDFEMPDELKDCRSLLLAKEYRLQIFRLNDGTHQANLSKADRSQMLILFITRYAIKDEIMVGERKAPDNSEGSWFWFNLNTRDYDYFFVKAEYLAALKKLGFAEEPKLNPVDFYCQKGDCHPCWATPTPERDPGR